MELRRYWGIIWRYRLMVLSLPLLVGLITGVLFLLAPPSYKAQAKVQLVLAPPQATGGDEFFRYDTYYTYLATEYAVDDLAEVINGNAFAAAVQETLRGPEFNLSLTDEEVRGTIQAFRAHRVLAIDVTTGNADRSVAIAEAAILTLQRDPLKYFSKGDLAPKQAAAIIPIQLPLEARGNRVSRATNVLLQTALAGCAGIGLAFLLAYLNDRVRDVEGVEESLGLPVLGKIPVGGRA